MSAHARLSASAASRWMQCPASVRLSEGLEKRDSEAAAYGTRAHEISATCLEHPGAQPEHSLGTKKMVDGFEITCDQEMVDGIHVYLDALAEDEQPEDMTWVEMPLLEALQTVDKDFGGTADRVRFRPSTLQARVTDLKFGSGVFVDETDNVQLKTYALGALIELEKRGLRVLEVELTIVQPRHTGSAPVRSYAFPAVELLDFEADLKVAANRTRDPQEQPISGSWCKWCPAKVNAKGETCPALEKQRNEVMAMDFTSVVAYDPAQLAKGLQLAERLKGQIKAMESFAYQEALAGRWDAEAHGFKLVEKRPTRYVKDTDGVIAWCNHNAIDPYTAPTLKSPAQLEAAVAEAAPKGKKKEAKTVLAVFFDSKSSGTALVPISDSRAPVQRLAAPEDFAALPDGDSVKDLF